MALFVAALAIWFVLRVAEVLLLVCIAALCAVYLSALTDLLERRFRLARWMGLVASVVVAGLWPRFPLADRPAPVPPGRAA